MSRRSSRLSNANSPVHETSETSLIIDKNDNNQMNESTDTSSHHHQGQNQDHQPSSSNYLQIRINTSPLSILSPSNFIQRLSPLSPSNFIQRLSPVPLWEPPKEPPPEYEELNIPSPFRTLTIKHLTVSAVAYRLIQFCIAVYGLLNCTQIYCTGSFCGSIPLTYSLTSLSSLLIILSLFASNDDVILRNMKREFDFAMVLLLLLIILGQIIFYGTNISELDLWGIFIVFGEYVQIFLWFWSSVWSSQVYFPLGIPTDYYNTTLSII